MNTSQFKFNERTGTLTDLGGVEVGAELNGALVVDIDGKLHTTAEISWTIYHGPVSDESLRVIPITPGRPLAIQNLKTVHMDDVKANFEVPGYMFVDQQVLDVSDPVVEDEAVEVTAEETVSDETVETPVEEVTVDVEPVEFDKAELMPSGKWRAYALVHGKVQSVGEFRKKKDALKCSDHHTSLENARSEDN